MNMFQKWGWNRFNNTLLASFFIALFCIFPATAADPHIQDKASDGVFTGLALVTKTLDWYDQFKKPETPHIEGKSRFASGETGAIATLFSNAQVKNDRVLIECEIKSFGPDGSTHSQPSGVCYDGPAQPPNTLYASLLDLRFKIGDDDPVGLAGFEILMRDLNSGRSVKLKVSFLQGSAQ
jgi:hypothetical protein